MRERREHLRRNLLFLDDGLHHAVPHLTLTLTLNPNPGLNPNPNPNPNPNQVAHLWGLSFGAAAALVTEWEEQQMPTQAVYELLQAR